MAKIIIWLSKLFHEIILNNWFCKSMKQLYWWIVLYSRKEFKNSVITKKINHK